VAGIEPALLQAVIIGCRILFPDTLQ
jgi:hypothetical protein